MAIVLSDQARQMAVKAALDAEARGTCLSTRHSFQFYHGARCVWCRRTHDEVEADHFYAELKARLDERTPA